MAVPSAVAREAGPSIRTTPLERAPGWTTPDFRRWADSTVALGPPATILPKIATASTQSSEFYGMAQEYARFRWNARAVAVRPALTKHGLPNRSRIVHFSTCQLRGGQIQPGPAEGPSTRQPVPQQQELLLFNGLGAMGSRTADLEHQARGLILWLNGKGFPSGMCACGLADLRDGAVLCDLAAVVSDIPCHT
jgi:hypothetical protein